MVPEAKLVETGHGLAPEGEGWFVVNARDVPWSQRGDVFGRAAVFEAEQGFPEIGINLRVLEPGKANCYYHGENHQEGILVLAGECLLLIEEEEHPLRAWDYVHLPAWTEHVLVGAGSGPCLAVMIGARFDPDEVVYPVSELALRLGAGVAHEARDPADAYAGLPTRSATGYHEGDLP